MIPGSATPRSLEAALRRARILFAGFLSAWLLFLLAIYLTKPAERPVSPTIVTLLGVAAAADLAVGFTRRKALVDSALEALESDPADGPALGKWFLGNVIGFAVAETVALFGVVLKFQGAGWNVAGPFFAAGLLALLLWQPRLSSSA